MYNVLLVWNTILTIIVLGIIILSPTKDSNVITKADLHKEMIYDIVVEEAYASNYHYIMGYDLYAKERVVTLKEAIEMLYRKLGTKIEYTPEKIDTRKEKLIAK